MSLRLGAAACALAALFACGVASAESLEAVNWTPQGVAVAVERQASRSTFADLEAFGRQAVASQRPDRLERIEHVAWVMLNQADYTRFKRWNDILRSEAAKAHSSRYVQIADLDAVRARSDQGDMGADQQVQHVIATATDWFVRSHAMVIEATALADSEHSAPALRMLADADALAIAGGDRYARSGVWEIEGSALMKLNDLMGSAAAFGRSQFEFGHPDYPRPDYDPIWNMAGLAAKLGRLDLAQSLYAADHRLSLRSDMASEMTWDDDLCAKVAEARDDPSGVLACVAPLGADLKDAQFVAHQVLPARAIAYARLGKVDLAERDLAKLEQLHLNKDAAEAYFQRIPEVQAAILHAKGRDAEAFETLRRYARAQNTREVSQFSQGVGQLTAEMAKQMNIRQLQLTTAQRNLALVDRMVRDQRILALTGALVVLGVLVLVMWQFKVLRQLRAARAEAEAGSRAKGEFLANMSHEIRTPLNGLLTMAELMDRSPLAEEQKTRLAVVRQSGQDLLRVLNDILDFSKIEAGKLELEDIEFDPRHVLESTLAGFAAAAEQKGLQIWFDIAEDAYGLRRGDPSRLRQIAGNFISNALKFTQIGGVTVAVTGVGENGRDGLQLAVRDTGCGIPADKMALLFQKFSQVDASTTRRFGGTGLGLAICQELAGMMGGTVWAESAEGQGSTFYACLMIPYVGVVPAPANDAPFADMASTNMSPLRVLAAEDNPTNQVVLSTIMQMFGFELTLVGDGARAVEAWSQKTFDVVLMDVQMPVMDGVQATRAIRAAEGQAGRSRTPIIALSANAFKHQIDDYVAAGMDAHIAKPIDLVALQDALEAVLAQAEGAAYADEAHPDEPLAANA
jgi:signal transduction histidine kinase/FixJ family two-component response regulator